VADKCGLHELESGLIHTADSLAGGARGQFVQQYGEPGDSTTVNRPERDRGVIGKQPKLGTRFMAKENR
jgi:hypothetical protein